MRRRANLKKRLMTSCKPSDILDTGNTTRATHLYHEVNRLALGRPVEPLHHEALGVQSAQEAQRRHLPNDV